MKTRLSYTCRNSVIELLLDDAKRSGPEDRQVLASMTLFEGTGAWMLVDLRLARHRMPSAYSGGVRAEDVHAFIAPASEEEAQRIRSMLREYREDEEGIHWSTFDGLVRGKPRENCGWAARNNHVGYFTRKEGLAYLQEAQAWWAAYEGDFEGARLANPNRQPSESMVRFALAYPELCDKPAGPSSGLC